VSRSSCTPLKRYKFHLVLFLIFHQVNFLYEFHKCITSNSRFIIIHCLVLWNIGTIEASAHMEPGGQICMLKATGKNLLMASISGPKISSPLWSMLVNSTDCSWCRTVNTVTLPSAILVIWAAVSSCTTGSPLIPLVSHYHWTQGQLLHMCNSSSTVLVTNLASNDS